MIATSGGGLGHLTRSLAIATSIRVLEPTYEIIFVTSSNALDAIRREGFLFYYIPSRVDTSKKVSNSAWMHQMELFLGEIVSLHKPRVIVYDAAYPYLVVSRVAGAYGVKKTVWVKRECYKPGREALNLLEERFGMVITPKEFPFDVVEDKEKKKYVDPITYLDIHALKERQWVRKKYGVKNKECLLYLQLGTGVLCDTRMKAMQAIEALRKRRHVRMLLGEYPNGQSIGESSRKTIIERDYPISRYFRGIDLAITAAGYNTFHELLSCRVPTLFIPNDKTKVDDQRKRGMLAEQQGYALCIKKNESIKEGVSRLFKEKERIKEALLYYPLDNGAVKAAEYILQYAYL